MKTQMPKFRVGNRVYAKLNGEEPELTSITRVIINQFENGFTYCLAESGQLWPESWLTANTEDLEIANQIIGWLEYGLALEAKKEKVKCMTNALDLISSPNFEWTHELDYEFKITETVFDKLLHQINSFSE